MPTNKQDVPSHFPKTMTIGVFRDVNDYFENFPDPHRKMSVYSHGIGIRGLTFAFAEKIEVLNLAFVSPEELGFENGARCEDAYKEGMKRGYGLCPGEVGLALCVYYNNQPEGEWIEIATESGAILYKKEPKRLALCSNRWGSSVVILPWDTGISKGSYVVFIQP